MNCYNEDGKCRRSLHACWFACAMRAQPASQPSAEAPSGWVTSPDGLSQRLAAPDASPPMVPATVTRTVCVGALPAASGAEPVAKRLVSDLVSAACRQESDPCEVHQNAYRAARDALESALYASPVARQPLTEEEILRIVGSDPDAWPVLFGMGQMPEICRLARAIERAHGIAATPAPRQDQADASQADSALVAAARNLLATFDELDKYNELAAIESEIAALREALKEE